jgi:shikimate kinase
MPHAFVKTKRCIMTDASSQQPLPPDDPQVRLAAGVRARLGTRSVVLIGMMGAGKSSVGRRLGKVLDLPFLDADTEIEQAAGMSIPEIFSRHGEAYFRAGETRVLSRLLDEGGSVIATGGGAWMNPETREHVRRCGISVWLKADADVLLRRVRKRGNRPLLKTGDPDATLRGLLKVREPFYAEADITVFSREVPQETMVSETLRALDHFLPPPGTP